MSRHAKKKGNKKMPIPRQEILSRYDFPFVSFVILVCFQSIATCHHCIVRHFVHGSQDILPVPPLHRVSTDALI